MSKKKPNKKPYLYEDSDYLFDLSKFVGKKIKAVLGYPSVPFGNDAPLFNIARIVFEDGTEVFVEGEHDVAYLPSDADLKNMDEETLASFLDDDEDDEE